MNDPRLESRIAAALDGFRIPESVPKELNGALVPPPSEGAALRLIARTLHALLVRRPAETVVLVETVGGMEDPGVGWRVAADGWLGALPLDVPLRDELVQHFDEDLEARELAVPSELPAVASVLAALAPGVRVLPTQLRTDSPEGSPRPTDLGGRLGRFLADRKVVVVAVSTLTRYGSAYSFVPAGLGPNAEAWLEANDERLLQRVRALDAEGTLTEAFSQHSADSAEAIALAVSSARPRDGWAGSVIEYTHSSRERGEPVFTESVGIAGVVF